MATVTNTTNTAVTWEVNGIVGGNSTVGTITTGGLYTAPSSVPAQNPIMVTAVSVADPTKSDTAIVTITLTVVINVSVNPPAPEVVVGAMQAFIAMVTGTSNTAVTWSISGTGSECSGAGNPCGTIDAVTGVYTAPSAVPTPATVRVTATSQADGTTTGTASVTVIVSLGVTISPPGSVGVAYSGQQQFNATVVGNSNPAVTWGLVCIADGEAPNPPNFPDCAGDDEGDGSPGPETNAIPGADQTATSAIFFAATGPDETKPYTLSLTATTVAVDGQGHTASATVTICVNAAGMVNSDGTCP